MALLPYSSVDGPFTTSSFSRLKMSIGSPWSPDWKPREPIRLPSCNTSTRSPSKPLSIGRDVPGPKLRLATPSWRSSTSPRDWTFFSARSVAVSESTGWIAFSEDSSLPLAVTVTCIPTARSRS